MSGKRTPRRSITDAVRSCFAPGAGVWRRVRRWWHSVDPYVVRGVPQAYRKGMVLFWWYGVFISMASAFVDPYVTLYALAMGATRLQVSLVRAGRRGWADASRWCSSPLGCALWPCWWPSSLRC